MAPWADRRPRPERRAPSSHSRASSRAWWKSPSKILETQSMYRIWEISRQIGEWEIANDPDADFVGLTMESVHMTAAPI